MEEKIIHITSGKGPAECMWVVAQVLREVLRTAQKEKVNAVVSQRVEGNYPRTLVSASVLISGENCHTFVNEWEGSILWIGESPYRKFHKRKNWFVDVKIYDRPKNGRLELRDIQFQATKSSGPGGQHVNKTLSAVRATHKGTGLSVLVQDSRSQHQNKKIATQRLNELFVQQQLDELKDLNLNQWLNNMNVQRGNPSRTFKGPKFKKVK